MRGRADIAAPVVQPRERKVVLLVAGVAVLGCWAALVEILATPASAPGSRQPSQWWCMPAMPGMRDAGGSGAALAGGLGTWLLMSGAMMLPAAFPTARRLAGLDSPVLAPLGFFGTYLGVWLAFGALTMALNGFLGHSHWAILSAAALAAAWQLTPWKRRALGSLGRGPQPLSATALSRHLRPGLSAGAACVASCWALMLAMSVAVAGQLLWALGITAAICAERLTPRPQLARLATSAALAGVAVAVALGA